jgi:predicted phage-related endonuclease
MSINELETKCRELRQLQALIDEAQAEADAIKDAIKLHMGDSETIYAGEYKITWKPVTASRIDTTALKKALPDVAQAFTRETTTRRFIVA